MTKRIAQLNEAELVLIAGGVTEGPDGQGCTDPSMPDTMPVPTQNGSTSQSTVPSF